MTSDLQLRARDTSFGTRTKLLGRIRRKMLSVGLPAVLDDLADDCALRPASTFKLKSLG